MSRPRFLADNDLKDQIVLGVLRRDPSIAMIRLRDIGLEQARDPFVLEYAAREGFIIVSHDINTMRAAAIDRIHSGQEMCGLLLVHQQAPIAQTIEDLILIGFTSDAVEWSGQIQFLPL